MLSPTFDAVADGLNGSAINVAKVNCEDHHDFCIQQNIQGFPTVFLYVDSIVYQYTGDRTAGDIKSWISQMVGPFFTAIPATELDAIDEPVFFVLDNASEETRALIETLFAEFKGKASFYLTEDAFGADERLVSFREELRAEHTSFDAPELIEFIMPRILPVFPEIGSLALSILARTSAGRLALFAADPASDAFERDYTAARELVRDHADPRLAYIYVNAELYDSFVERFVENATLPLWIVLDTRTRNTWVHEADGAREWLEHVAGLEVEAPVHHPASASPLQRAGAMLLAFQQSVGPKVYYLTLATLLFVCVVTITICCAITRKTAPPADEPARSEEEASSHAAEEEAEEASAETSARD
eukprot:gnl/Chilomastix_cuspidata/1265.p1 GENE.gnl/Chilomastix_cuspidata/1265~~gnl/Chilomastix_cuspidata/1265.p1  ORF type:complete len:420 (+),score=208.35 gnl/Chilomastix_cuspidata/1265:181-1260(+)